MSENPQSFIKQPSTLVPTKRNSLGNITNSEATPKSVMSPQAEANKENIEGLPKPSSIPRPNSTPTKTSSYLTPYGYKSPSSPSRTKSANTPNSAASRGVSEPLQPNKEPTVIKKESKFLSNSSYSRRELDSLKVQIEIRERDFTELKNSILSLRTSKQQIEFDNQALEEKFSSLDKDLKIKRNKVENLTLRKEEVRVDIQRDYELKLKQMKVENEACIYEIEKNYKNEIERLLSVKVSKIQKRKAQLLEQISKLNNDIQNNEVNFQQDLASLRKQYNEKQSELNRFMKETRTVLENECRDIDIKHKELLDDLNESEMKLEQETKAKEDQMCLLKESKSSSEDAELRYKQLQEKLRALKNSLSMKKTRIQDTRSEIQWKLSKKGIFEEQLVEEEITRRKLHNKMQELKGNIRVFCRVRPPLSSEIEEVVEVQVPDNDEEEQEIVLKDPKPISASSHYGNPQSSSNQKNYGFQFDRVFQMDSTNPEIFEEISQLVQSALDGFNVCIFAYGQTGSGKTFTMSNNDGMIPKAVEQIFETSKKLKNQSGWDFKIYGEFLEIYNENINDLLGNPNNIDKLKFEIRHDTSTQKTLVTDLTSIELENPQMVNEVLKKALKNRSIAATKANERSSRSHSVFTIRIHGKNPNTNETSEGVLNLIDLAGSERLSHSQASGDRLKETQSINKSLSCLGDVIYALGDSNVSKDGSTRKHIPFRNSKLTYLLQYSLMGNSKTLMFVNISPCKQHFNETINSLRFATKVNSTKIGTAKKNVA